MNPYTRFQGEDPWTSLIHHYGLTIEEEESFYEWLIDLGHPEPKELSDWVLQQRFQEWRDIQDKQEEI